MLTTSPSGFFSLSPQKYIFTATRSPVFAPLVFFFEIYMSLGAFFGLTNPKFMLFSNTPTIISLSLFTIL